MKNNKLVVSIIEVAIAAFVYSSACAKQIYPAEILGSQKHEWHLNGEKSASDIRAARF
ncbi:MAG: hypothetical protein NTU48_04850 [Legionellales bacterium]|nr:hypothetical protein [Legionellales bacterium]